jgi:hypothetical protein
MDITLRRLVLAVVLLASTGALALGQESARTASPRLSPEETEKFLLTAAMVGRPRNAGKGVTESQRATLSDGRLTHDVHLQYIDEKRALFEAGPKTEVNFRDWYGYNIAGYRVARLVGLETVPMSVERTLPIAQKPAAVTWWVDGIVMDEQARQKKHPAVPNPDYINNQLQVMLVFDELIQNKDRNQGNIQWTGDWTMWLIDHTRAFRTSKELLKPDQLKRCERGLLERLRGLTAESLSEAVGNWLTKDEKTALMARRDRIVKHFDELIAKQGDGRVLFTLAGEH